MHQTEPPEKISTVSKANAVTDKDVTDHNGRGVFVSEHFNYQNETKLAGGSVINLVQATISDPDGSEHKRDIVRHPGAVSIVAVDEDKHVYLVKQYRAPVNGEVWEIPAGKRDVEDEPPEITAERELEEEAGLKASKLEPLIGIHHSAGFTDEYCNIFLATGLTEVPQELHGPEETYMQLAKFPLAQTIEMIFNRQITDAKTVAGLFAAYRTIFS